MICDVLKNESEPVCLVDLEDNPKHGCVEKPKSALLHFVWLPSRYCQKVSGDGDMGDVALTQLCVWKTSGTMSC